MQRLQPMTADVLIVTFSRSESKAVLEAFDRKTDNRLQALATGDQFYRDLGVHNGVKLMMVALPVMEDGVMSKACNALDEAIGFLKPHAVILLGHAFGNDVRHSIGDILVSNKLVLLENNIDIFFYIRTQAKMPNPASRLVNFLHSAHLDWEGETVHFRPILTGDPLVYGKIYYIQNDNMSLSVEMEGTAPLIEVCEARKVDWILVKTISCYWAEVEKGPHGLFSPEISAKNVVEFLIHALRHAPLERPQIQNTITNQPSQHINNGQENPSTLLENLEPKASLKIPQDLIDACLKEECVAFIGSGLSAKAGLPTWRGFVEGLINEAVDLNLMTTKEAALQRSALQEGEINDVADNVVSAFCQQREQLLEYYRRTSTTDAALPYAYELLREIPFAGILTSNYDTLIDRAYTGTKYLPILTPQDSETLLELLSAREKQFVLKLYGDFDRPDTLILGPTDYQNLVRSNAAFSRFMEGLFFSRTLLFLGVSIEGLADYLATFIFPSGIPRQHYALVGVSGGSWQARALVLERRYNIKVLPLPITLDYPKVDSFLGELASKTKQQEETFALSNIPIVGPRLQKIILRNIGPFRELELEFSDYWKILLGDNGVGKSTILKAIGVAIVGSDARHFAGRLLRVGQTIGSITLITARNPSGYIAEIQKVGSSAEVVSHGGRALEAEGWVALGFPPLRSLSWKFSQGPQGMGVKRPSADDMLPILQGDADSRMDDLKQWLVNIDGLSRKEGFPELDRKRATEIRDKFFEIVGALTEGIGIAFKEVTSDFRVMIKTHDGIVPIEALSQGMTSLLSWVGILLQRLYEVHYGNNGVSDPTQEYALVLMDEIDAHMHPIWQQSLVGKLKSIFPNIQVIASTHSPLVVGGLPITEVLRLVRDEQGTVVVAQIDEKMSYGRADQVLTGDLFGLNTSLDTTTMQETQRYQALLGKRKRTTEEEEEFRRLRQVIRVRVPMSASMPAERLAQEVVSAILKEQLGEADEFAEARKTVEDRVAELLTEIQKQQQRHPK